MQNHNEKEYVELFHLLFLSQFGPKMDKSQYALKGGCNLHFYLNSIRCSEDMDIDLQHIAQPTLRNKVRKCLQSDPLKRILATRNIEIANFSETKQTETTQRWKIGLNVKGISQELRTKIEFSRRGPIEGCKFQPVSPDIIGKYSLSPILANHYPADIAFSQKIDALANRKETQARDVFDLDLILGKGIDIQTASHLKATITQAEAKAIDIPFDQFKSQVLAYLPQDLQTQYESPDIWDAIILRVTEALGKIDR
ncbi:MAG: hypothetical protein COB53_07525 [Elusimicrobia bacterium]|nr:MAG: hypothetical protein COB53_07525 [Elusimicrobiota bacterium]